MSRVTVDGLAATKDQVIMSEFLDGAFKRIGCCQCIRPANRRSLSNSTWSAPRLSASRNTSTAVAGPIVTTVTVPPYSSRTSNAISNAFKSSGLKIAGSAERLTVPSSFITLPLMLCVFRALA